MIGSIQRLVSLKFIVVSLHRHHLYSPFNIPCIFSSISLYVKNYVTSRCQNQHNVNRYTSRPSNSNPAGMVLPARYGRLWSVAAIILVFVGLLVFFSGSSTEYLRPPGFGLNDQKNLEPEQHEPVGAPQPAVPTTPSPTTTTRTRTTLNTSTSPTSRKTNDEAVSVETDISTTAQSPTGTTLGDVGVVAPSSILAAAGASTSGYFVGAGRLGQPGIQPEPSTRVNAPIATLADGGAVVVESLTPSSTSSSVMALGTTATTTGLTQAGNAEEITLAHGGGLG